MFPQTSRYYGLDTAQLTLPDGRQVVYLRRRFVPQGATLATLAEYRPKADDRLDNISNQFFQDPLQFWRICDANDVLRPEDLTDERHQNKPIRIPLPQGR
jgi:hypothetical protein